MTSPSAARWRPPGTCRQWSRINPSLYSICFSGVVRANKRCDLCLGLTHETKDCALSGEVDHDVGSRLKATESAVLALTSARPSATPQPTIRQPKNEVCRTWNENLCTCPRCRCRHVFRVCGGPKPAVECCERALVPVRSPNGPPVGRYLSEKPRDTARPY